MNKLYNTNLFENKIQYIITELLDVVNYRAQQFEKSLENESLSV